MRVLFVDQFADVGGGQKILLGLVRKALAEGWQVAVALPTRGNMQARLDELGAQVYPLSVPGMSKGTKTPGDALKFLGPLVAVTRRLSQITTEYAPDVVHVNGGRVLLQAVGARLGRPLVFHLHSTYDHGPTRQAVRAALRTQAVSGVLVPSEFMGKWAVDNLRLGEDRLKVVHNWVEDGFFGVRPADLSSEWGWESDITTIGVWGRINPDKGQSLVVEAVRDLKEERSDLGLVLIGPVDPAAGGEGYWKAMGPSMAALGSLFTATGTVDDIPRLLAGVSIAVVPSVFREPFGLAAAEAMAAGIPVVVSPRGALPEVVGDTGIVAQDCTAAAFADSIRKLLRSEDDRKRMSRAGRERAQRLFSEARQTDEVLEVLLKAAGTGV